MTYSNPDALVSTGWLAENLTSSGIRIVEVDEDVDAYAGGHIPGAIAWHWTADLQHPTRRDYIDRSGVEKLLSWSGVGEGDTVVLYGGNDNWFAAYAYWLLKLRGFDDVTLLDGGRKKWELEGLPLETEFPEIEPTEVRIAGHERPEIRAFREDVLEAIGSGSFVDVRSPQEFSGEKLAPDHLPQEQPYVGGHVPGAHNIPWSKAANDDGTFRTASELREIYADVLDGSSDVIAYCRIGERSSHTWFVLSELLGRPDVRNYDGSWTEYGSLVNVPVETGP